MYKADDQLNQSSLTPLIRVLIAAALVVTLIPNPAQAKSSDDKTTPELTGQALWDLTEGKLFNGQIHQIYIKMNQAVWNQLHDDEKNNSCVKGENVKWGHVRYFVLAKLTLNVERIRRHFTI